MASVLLVAHSRESGDHNTESTSVAIQTTVGNIDYKPIITNETILPRLVDHCVLQIATAFCRVGMMKWSYPERQDTATRPDASRQ